MTRFTNLRLKLSLLAVAVALAGASALAQISGSQYIVTSGTQTANLPVFTATQTWNAGGVSFQGILLTVTNTASAAGAHLLDLVAGAGGVTNMFNVDKSGNVTAAAAYSGTTYTGTATTNQLILGTTNVDTISFSAPAASRTITFADPLGNDSVTYLAATQTLTNKTLTTPVIATITNTGTLTLPTNTGSVGTGYSCGNALAAGGACANTALAGTFHVIFGSAALSAGTSAVTGVSPAFTSSTSWWCNTNDITTIANPSKAVPSSGSALTFTGTGTDTIQFICYGN